MLLTLSGRELLSHPPNRSTIQSKKTPDLYTEEEEEEEEEQNCIFWVVALNMKEENHRVYNLPLHGLSFCWLFWRYKRYSCQARIMYWPSGLKNNNNNNNNKKKKKKTMSYRQRIIIILKGLYRIVNFTLRKFHAVKDWYQFLTAREELVPIRHGFHTNMSHVWEKYARSQISCSNHTYSSHRWNTPKAVAFCFRFQFFTRIA